MATNKITSFDKEFKALKGWKKFRYIMAIVCFITAGTFVFLHLGFIMEDDTYQTGPFLTRENLWIVNGCLGIVGGALFAIKRFLLGGLSGLIAAAAITGSTLLYLSWRDNVYIAELVLPLCTGLIGIGLYKSLTRNSNEA